VTPEESELEQAMRKWRLEYPAETPEEKTLRLSIQDWIDRVVIVGYGTVVALSVISCAVAMLIFSSGVLEFLFTLSFIQGPFVVYQRLQLVRLRSKREAIASLCSEINSLKQANDDFESKISTMYKDTQRLKSTLSRYKAVIKGYDISGITDLYHENETINEQKKLLAEAMGLEKLTKSILRTDVNSDHYVGDAELSLLSNRLELIEGVPFTSQEMIDRFRLEEEQNLRTLADLVRTLYIEKRRGQEVAAKAAEVSVKSPRHLGGELLWKKKIDGIDERPVV